MDLDAIKQKLSAMQNKGGKQGNGERKEMFWRPTVGKHTIRIVPSKFNKSMPFTEMYFHYGIDKPVMVSPINFSEKDPIVEFAKQLRQTTDPQNWKLAKKIEPKARYFAPVVIRGEEDKGVRLWQFGKEVYETFLQMAVDEEVGDFTDVMSGRDIKVTTVEGNPYNRTTVAPSMKNSATGESDQVQEWLDNQPNPMEVFKRYSFEEMKQSLQNWLNPEAEEGAIIDDEKEEEAPQTNYSLNTSANAVKQSKLDKFDSLFEEDDDLPF